MKLYWIESYFTTEEFACPCECGFGSKESDIHENLINKINMMRMLYGKPMVVTSGARCVEYNAKIGGVSDSAHLPHSFSSQCRAVDIAVRNSYDRFTLIRIADKVGITRIGVGPDFLHFDVAWDLPDMIIFNY